MDGFNILRIVVLGAMLIVLSACSQPELHDLEQFIDETRSNQRGRVEPLPQFKPFETFQYSAVELRDPFQPWQSEADDESNRNSNALGPKPDFDRRKELLEKYPLDSLKMVGTLSKDGNNWAIIRAPDSMIYRVQEGNYLGENHGKIIQLAEESLALKELVPDGLGGWIEREAAITLVDE